MTATAPGLFWLSGFRSDMAGTKAEALDQWAEEAGHACTRFDYSGHGRSGGRFEDGTICRWLEEAEAVFDAYTAGPQIVIGSSMGGWLALLLARQLRERHLADRLAGMILIAPAIDMTKELMSDRFNAAAKRALAEQGFCAQPSAYSGEPYVITRGLIEDGESHLFGDQPIEAGCPVHVIQGMQDRGRAVGASDEADGAACLRRCGADAGPRRRPPPVAAGGFGAPEARGGGDGERLDLATAIRDTATP